MAGADRDLDANLLILMSLATGPKHGYAMIKDIAAFADATIGPGTLYTAIERLERAGHIVAVASADRRKPYRLSLAGTAALRDQTRSLRRLTTIAARRLAIR